MHSARFCHCENGKYTLGPGCARMHETWRMIFPVVFFEMIVPNPPYYSKTHVFARFARFHHCENYRYKLGPGRALDARNMANELFGPFLGTNMTNTTF